MVICLERGADLHMAQLMPLPLTVSCFSKIQIGFTFLVPAHPGSSGKGAIKRVCVCMCHQQNTNKSVAVTHQQAGNNTGWHRKKTGRDILFVNISPICALHHGYAKMTSKLVFFARNWNSKSSQ